VARSLRYHRQFRQDLQGRARWLKRNRPPEQLTSLQQAVNTFVHRVTAFPALGTEVEKRGTISYRVRLLGEPLPYVVWWSFDEGDPDGPVSLLMLLHEAQDRARFDPNRFVDE
jgi:plasmid stabilization system protein ParE